MHGLNYYEEHWILKAKVRSSQSIEAPNNQNGACTNHVLRGLKDNGLLRYRGSRGGGRRSRRNQPIETIIGNRPSGSASRATPTDCHRYLRPIACDPISVKPNTSGSTRKGNNQLHVYPPGLYVLNAVALSKPFFLSFLSSFKMMKFRLH